MGTVVSGQRSLCLIDYKLIGPFQLFSLTPVVQRIRGGTWRNNMAASEKETRCYVDKRLELS